MMLGGGQEDERHRLRIGLVVLMVGLAVLLGAVAMAILRAPSPTGDSGASDAALAVGGREGLTSAYAGMVIPVLAGLAIVLVVTLLVVSYALFRLTRRLAVPEEPAKKDQPTPTDDIWRMHRVPEEPPDQEADHPESGNHH